MIDTYKHKGQRQRLVDSLAAKGIADMRVLEAIRAVPRHLFVESALADMAYEDKALPIAQQQTISQPYTVAYQTELLQVSPGMKVLEIGTGSGYQAAVLAQMGVKLHSVEVIRELHQTAAALLHELGLAVSLHLADGSLGLPSQQPFDRIIVTAASPDIPQALKLQLKVGGRLVIPVGSRNRQQMCVVVRTAEKHFEIQRLQNFVFVPLMGANGFAAS